MPNDEYYDLPLAALSMTITSGDGGVSWQSWGNIGHSQRWLVSHGRPRLLWPGVICFLFSMYFLFCCLYCCLCCLFAIIMDSWTKGYRFFTFISKIYEKNKIVGWQRVHCGQNQRADQSERTAGWENIYWAIVFFHKKYWQAIVYSEKNIFEQ